MVSCRYVGGDSSMIGDREFDAVGQKATLSEQGYREAVVGGAAFIPEDDFKKVGFTSDELDKHGPVGIRVNPPTGFCDKVLKAQEVFRDIRNRMLRDSRRTISEVSETNVGFE